MKNNQTEQKINPSSKEIKEILETTSSKSDKIRALLNLNYSVKQISKKNFPQLDAHYSHVLSVARKTETIKE